MTYFICQGQQVVVEYDDGGRDCVILAAVSHSEPHERRGLIPTSVAVLGPKVQERRLMNRIKETHRS